MSFELPEIESRQLLNLTMITRYGPYEGFSRRIDLNINLEDKIQGMYYRQYFFMSIMILTRYLSYSALLPMYSRICNKTPDVLMNDIWHFFNYKKNGGAKINGMEYRSLFSIMPDTFGNSTVVELTGNGLNYYKELNKCISFSVPITKLKDEEIDYLYASSRSRQPGAHYLFTYTVALTFLSSLRSNFINDFTVEAERGDYYEYSYESRKRNRILPDVSLRYRTSSEYLSPIYLEADKSTENGKRFFEKCRNELSFCLNQTRNNYQFPCMIIYVTDKSRTVKTKSVSMHEADQRRKGRFLSSFNDNSFALLETTVMLFHDLYSRAKVPEETINGLTVIDLIEYLSEIISIEPEGKYESGKRALDSLNKCVEYYISDRKTGAPLLNNLAVLKDYCNQQSAELLKSNAKIAEEKVSASLDSRKFNAAKNLMGRNEQIAYCSGQSLAFVPINELQTAVKSLIPYLAAQPNVKAVASVFGFNGKIKKYWSTHPSCKIGNSYYINKRNSFRFDDTILFFEDLSYDISAIVRLREYLSISPDLISNTIGCFIVNDDFTVSTGEHIADTFYWRAGKYESDEYHEMFLKRVDANGQVPYFFSIGADFCIIKRSEFLSGDSSQIHPFVIFGHKESDLVYRTTEGMDSVKPFHMGGMNVFLPITHPEEFDHYI